MDKHNILRWMGLTGQQSLLVSVIYDLQTRNVHTSPINIEKEYLKETNTFIQKSNLFTQLKILQGKNIIRKDGQSRYYLDIEGIKEIILLKKKELAGKLVEIEKIASETDVFLKKIASSQKVSTTYLDEKELYRRLASSLKNASTFYLGCDFPHYGYSFSLCADSSQALYIENLISRLSDKEFKLLCLCSCKLESVIRQLNDKYSNKETIKDELNRLNKNLIENSNLLNNIDIRKISSPLDFALIEDKDGKNFLFMFLKDSNRVITGGILINSIETTKQIKQHFLSQMSHSPVLDIKKDLISLSLNVPLAKPKKKLIAFDVNRVFTVNHTTVEIAKKVGKYKEVSALIKKQINGQLGVQEAIGESARLFKGLSVDEINELVKKILLIKNVKEGIQKLKKKGYHIVAISTGFSHIINPLCNSLGIDDVYCNVLEEKNGKLTGDILEKNVAIDNVKYYIVKYLLEKYSIPEEQSIGVGDGYSDLDMLRATKLRIAFNPSSELEKVFKQKTPLINIMIKERDFMVLADKIIKNS